MSKFDLPELPSDDDLGITDEDREFLKELGGDEPEMSDAEMKALLGDVPKPSAPAGEEAKPDRKAARAAKKAAKEAKKAEKRKAKEEAKRKSAAAKAGKGDPERAPTDSERAESLARSLAASSRAAARGEATEPGARGGDGPQKGGPKKDGPKPAAPGAESDGSRSRWRGPATLAALIVLSIVASSRTGLPRPVPANAPDTAFSSARAMSTLIGIASEAHPPGSPEHTRVREFLIAQLESLGLEPEVQTTTMVLDRGDFARAATVRNIVARIPGTDPSGAVLMTAHYDGREISVAASDDGVGVVTIVEAVRALLSDGTVRNDIIVLLTDAEELGLMGARAFAESHPWMNDVSIVLSFEMRGSAGPSIMFETNDQNGWVVGALKEFDPRPFANSMAFEVYARMPNDTDFTPFKEAGKQGLNFAAIDNAHVYHQEYDTPQVVSESTLQHHGIHALAAARYFGDADLSVVDAPNVVYFSVPGLGLVVYGRMWVLALSGALLLMLVGTFLLAKRSGARPSRIGISLGVTVVALGLVFGAAYALFGWLPRFHPEAGALHGSSYHREGWYLIALAGIALTVVTTLYGISRRWLSTVELGLGAVVLPFAAAIGLSFAMPLAAMNLQWPVLAALVSLAVMASLGPRSDAIVGWLTAVLLTVPVLFLLVPMTELVWLALTLELGTALAILMATTFLLCVPALEALRHPNSWWAPVVGLVVAGVGVGLGIVTARPNAERPAPSTLVYAYEHGTGSAVWVTDANADSLDGAAIAWARQRAGGAFEGRRDLSGFGYRGGQSPTATATVVSADPPEVVLTRDTIDGAVRKVTLTARSRIGAELMAFMYDDRGDTRLLSINGEPLSDPAALGRAEHWGLPDPVVTLELEMPSDQAIGLHVIEHLLRPEELLGPDAFDRPPNLAPDITRLSDRAMFRYSVGAFADPRHALPLPGSTPSAAPGSGVVQPDSLTAAQDSAVADTISTATPPDTGGVAIPDTTGSATPPDTGGIAIPDTTGSATPPDTGVVAPATPPDTGSVAPAARPDTMPANPATRPDTGAAPILTRAPPDRTPAGATRG